MLTFVHVLFMIIRSSKLPLYKNKADETIVTLWIMWL